MTGKHRTTKTTRRLNRPTAAAAGIVAATMLAVTPAATANQFFFPTTATEFIDLASKVPAQVSDAGFDVPQEVITAAAGLPDFANSLNQSGSSVVEKIPAKPVVSENRAVADHALSQTGTPYVWGGAQPGGFDCSGLVTWAYQQVGKSIPRTSQDQMASGTYIGLDSLQPGDVIGFYSGNTHVGVYIGNGQVVHAPQTGDVVRVADMHSMPISGAVRF